MAPFASPTLRLSSEQHEAVIAHCHARVPEEACGLFAGPVDGSGEPTGVVDTVYATTNTEASARTYTVDSRDLIKAMRDAESRGLGLIGVYHSHTHTDAYPSATDVRQASYPEWIYALVSLKDPEPVVRAYRIRDGEIAEVQVVVSASDG